MMILCHYASTSFRLSEAQDAGEQRTERFIKYREGVAELATQRFAKSGGGDSGSAGKPGSPESLLSGVKQQADAAKGSV